jgi:hypothetical protein
MTWYGECPTDMCYPPVYVLSSLFPCYIYLAAENSPVSHFINLLNPSGNFTYRQV